MKEGWTGVEKEVILGRLAASGRRLSSLAARQVRVSERWSLARHLYDIARSRITFSVPLGYLGLKSPFSTSFIPQH